MKENKMNIILPAENIPEAENIIDAIKIMNPGEQQALLNYIRDFRTGPTMQEEALKPRTNPKQHKKGVLNYVLRRTL